nr:tyrosine-type recombinase/integrase [Microvirga antarctica]
MNGEAEAYWRGLVEGQAAEAKRRYDLSRRRAKDLGFQYATAAEIAEGPTTEILARLERLMDKGLAEDDKAVEALTGLEKPPEIMLSHLFEEYESLSRASIADLSPDQKRKWRNPKKRALENIVSVVKDKPLHRLSRSDALDFQAWWQDRILAEGVQIGTANKDICHLNKMFRTVDRRHRLGLDPIFGDLRIEGEQENSRTAFEPNFVQAKLLKTGVLDALNEEARRALYLMSETGLRLSEAVNLTTETIHLTAAVPYVSVRPDGRRMKTAQSARDVPLVGVALEAMRLQPDGFPRYRDRGATLSATVNKFLSDNNLRPTEGHSLYSLRHTFEDRLTAVEAPEKLIAALMGHKYSRPKYGSGPSLEQKCKWLQQIAFKPPSTV